jgi:hypothetical protein
MTTTRTQTTDPFVAGLIASIGLVALAAACVPLRSWLGNTNVALVLVVGIVAAAALGGRAAGVAGSFAAALAYDFFHTLPHYAMTVEARVDRITTVLLFVVGILVGEIVVRTQRARREADVREDEVVRLRRTAHLASAADPSDLIPVLEDEIGAALGLWFCRYQRGPLDHPVPRLTRHGVTVPVGVAPITGDPNSWAVELPVRAGDRVLGRFVLVPHEPAAAGGFTADERRDAIALADQLGAALASRDLDALRRN